MYSTIHVLDIPISNITRLEAKQTILNWLDSDNKKVVYTPNPEIVMAARQNLKLKDAISKASLVVPDGIGVVWASKYSEKKITERVAGCDLVLEIFNEIKNKNKTVYILGGAPGVAEIAKKNMEDKYKGLKVVGVHDGYFKQNEDTIVISEINKCKPDFLLVCLGAPKQELWIYDNLDKLDIKVAIGVGGSVDVMAGTVKRAPQVFRKLNLEWFYRLLKQPTRIGRMMVLPKFALTVLRNQMFNK